ncbi:hypothetical protein M3Y99_01380500 [Aphelenchoides fujianensis]|nr:hypothetical protein M3Y99_01380500 [Aphelenchoides fujianensis]
MVAFSGMVVFQTREAFQRFVNPASKPVPRFESTQWEPIPRPGLVICTEKQVASVMRGYGSVDFRMLLSEYAKDNPDLSIFDRVQLEFGMLERLLNGTPTEEAIAEVRKELTHFKELAMFLDGYRIFRKRQFSFDECWRDHRQRTEDRARFVECRLEKTRRRFAEFQHSNENFFDYFFNVSLKFEDHDLEVSAEAREIEDDLLDSLQDRFYVRTNYFENLQGASMALFLFNPIERTLLNKASSEHENGAETERKIELFSGEYLEIELTGFEEFQNELCTNRYPSVCSRFQRPSTAYSYDVCRWCDAWIKTCTCE